MRTIHRCRLCKNENELCDSHIIPRGLLAISKAKNPQLIALRDGAGPRWDNANWNEELLCKNCEQHINLSYEKTQIAALKKKKLERHSGVTITNFEFNKFYLFWISILWRASESSLAVFASVQLPPELSELLRIPLLTTRITGNLEFLPDLLQVGVSRWKMEDVETRPVITSFYFFKHNECACYMFLVSGLAVIYQISNRPCQPLPEGFSLVKKSFNFRMNTMRIGQFYYLDRMIQIAQNCARQDPDFI